jgi:hypothetical protein
MAYHNILTDFFMVEFLEMCFMEVVVLFSGTEVELKSYMDAKVRKHNYSFENSLVKLSKR